MSDTATLNRRLHDAVDRIAELAPLDRIANPLRDAVKRAIPADSPQKDALSGSWLGHPLHPLLTDIPIGAFTSATLLDLLGGKRARRGANLLASVGVLSAVPTAAAGLADWSETTEEERRIGVVHTVSNVVGVTLYARSIVARARGHRARATSLGLLRMGVMSLGGYLGGHLSYVRGVGVNNTFAQREIDEWTPVVDDSELLTGRPMLVEAAGVEVMLVRTGGRVLALADRCSHAGGPLHEGGLDERHECVQCPWHRSVFRLGDGAVVHGPATVPAPVYDVRLEGGKVEIRSRPRS